MGTWSSRHWWAVEIRTEVRGVGLGRRQGETLGEEKVKEARANRRHTCGEPGSEIAEQLVSREEDDSEGEYQFQDKDA